MSSGVVIYIFPSIFLKQSNRSFLNNLGINSIEVFVGTGGGNYVKEVYKDYLVTLNDDELLIDLILNIQRPTKKQIRKR